MVREAKGDKDRYVPLPARYREELQRWLERRQTQYLADKAQNMHEVEVPRALVRKIQDITTSTGRPHWRQARLLMPTMRVVYPCRTISSWAHFGQSVFCPALNSTLPM